MNQWTRAGIQAYRAGNNQQARRFFRLAEMENPNELRAWLWSVELAESDEEKQRCLEQIILLDPGQVAAWSALAELKSRAGQKNDSPHISPFVTDDLDINPPSPASQEVPSKPFITEAPLPPYEPGSESLTIPNTGKKSRDLLTWPWKVWKELVALFKSQVRD